MPIETLEREGGHIAMLATLFVFCVTLSLYYPEVKMLTDFSNGILGALLFCMKGNSENYKSGVSSVEVTTEKKIETTPPASDVETHK
jgi:hypothetical protein